MAMKFLSNGPRRINWRAVNTMQYLKLDINLIAKMNATVSNKYGQLYEDFQQIDDLPEVFILEIEKEFKYGKGKSMVAIAAGGKNKVGHEVKYVKWYNLYGEDADNSKNKLKIMEQTYTYGVDKARDFWNEKIKEGYNRVK
tara:strand:- start:2232 stop:2654 length:423 start_codon:yes stop_codon:yes gene_type:complete